MYVIKVSILIQPLNYTVNIPLFVLHSILFLYMDPVSDF